MLLMWACWIIVGLGICFIILPFILKNKQRMKEGLIFITIVMSILLTAAIVKAQVPQGARNYIWNDKTFSMAAESALKRIVKTGGWEKAEARDLHLVSTYNLGLVEGDILATTQQVSKSIETFNRWVHYGIGGIWVIAASLLGTLIRDSIRWSLKKKAGS